MSMISNIEVITCNSFWVIKSQSKFLGYWIFCCIALLEEILEVIPLVIVGQHGMRNNGMNIIPGSETTLMVQVEAITHIHIHIPEHAQKSDKRNIQMNNF